MSHCCSMALSAPNAAFSSRHDLKLKAPLSIASNSSRLQNNQTDDLSQNLVKIKSMATDFLGAKKTIMAAQIGAILTTFDYPAMAVTGVNNEQELSRVLIDVAIISVWYFLVMPPIIMNWLRIRWYRRKFVEMYFQFMFVFMFFPGLLLWAPFLNFRKFPRDPDMKYPWDTPKDPSIIKNGYLKYPFAKPEDYE